MENPEALSVLADVIAGLLASDQPQHWQRQLEAAELLSVAGLTALTEHARQLIRENPEQGRQLALRCAILAEQAHLQTIQARALYIQAQAHALNAEFDHAHDLIVRAQACYQASGETFEALRTTIGLMNILREQGRYDQALESGHAVIARLAAYPSSDDVRLLYAMVQQNCGLCYECVARYPEALHAYQEAEQHYQQLAIHERVGEARTNYGIVLLHMGRVHEGLRYLESAVAIFVELGQTLPHAQTLINIGDAHLLLGNYTQSLAAFRQARELFGPLAAMADKHVLLLDTADAYLALNLYPEALDAYREADQLLAAAGMSHEHARALWGMGAALAALGHTPAARHALDRAAERFRQAEHWPMLAEVLLEQAALWQVVGDSYAALHAAEQALLLADRGEWPIQQIYARLRYADLVPDHRAAEQALGEATLRSERLALPQLRYRLLQRRGHLALQQGRIDQAQQHLGAALQVIEQLRGHLSHEIMRASFLSDKMAAYDDLVQILLDPRSGASAVAAFGMAEQARSRALLDLLNGHARAIADDPTEVMALQADLHATYTELLAGAQDALRMQQLHARASELEQAIARLRLQSSPLPPSIPGARLNERPPDPQQLLAQLPADLPYLIYYTLGHEILAFVLRDRQVQVLRQLATTEQIDQLQQRLAIQLNRFQQHTELVEPHMAQLERSAQRILGEFYQLLIAPLLPLIGQNAALPEAQPLVIIPHGALHQLPFHAFFDGHTYLIDQFEISYAPGAMLYAHAEQRQRQALHQALVVGVADPSIPGAVQEVQAVAALLPTVTLLINQAATIAAVEQAAVGCDLLHLACHGLFRSDSPMFSALKLADGWLSAADLMRMRLDGAMVVLSACESGRNRVVGGDELIGMSRAILGAGAVTLVASLWLAHDQTTTLLMMLWYQHIQQGVRPSQALRIAQQIVRSQRSHPFYWASFVMIGKR